MFKQLVRKKFAVLCAMAVVSCICLPCQATSPGDHVTKVYVLKDKPGIVRYDTDSKQSQVLIQDSESVFFVLETSSDKEWVALSKMAADPDEASGTNEEKLLMYVPQKKIVLHPKYGVKAALIGIDEDGTKESILWDIDEKTDTVSIDKLRSSYLGAAFAKKLVVNKRSTVK